MRVLVTSFALAVLISCTSKPPQQEARDATTKSTSEIGQPNLVQQKMCAEQAKKTFDDTQQQTRQLGGDQPLSDYTSHFDPQSNICYVRIIAMTASKGGGVTNSDIVYDAFERRVFASYLWMNYSGKKYWEVAPSECEVHPPHQPPMSCRSSEEFNGLVEKWLGVAQ